MAFDTDGFCFPLLTGVRFDGYDKSIVRVVGGLLIPVSPGTTRVTVHWHNFSDSFVVTVAEGSRPVKATNRFFSYRRIINR